MDFENLIERALRLRLLANLLTDDRASAAFDLAREVERP
jgi:hypothetical protein